MKTLLILLSASVMLAPQGQGGTSTPICGCEATVSWDQPDDLTCCSNSQLTPPIIVPTSPWAVHGDCDTNNNCAPKTNEFCSGGVDVQVTFPSNGSSCATVWVQGGSVYPTPTRINSNSRVVTLYLSAACGGSPGTGEESFEMWCQQPNGASADSKFTAKLTCQSCGVFTPSGPMGQ